MTTLSKTLPMFVFLSAVALACEQPPPPGSGDGTSSEDQDSEGETPDETADTGTGDGDAETETGEDPSDAFDDTLYPLTDGATWTYIAKNYSGQILSDEIVDCVEVEWEGETAWMLVDNPNDAGNYTESTIARDGPHTFRVHKEIKGLMGTNEIVDYVPGFTRAHDDWNMTGQSEEYVYDRISTDGDGLNQQIQPRAHIFTVLDDDVEVTVPAGTFNCIQIERVRSLGGNIGERVLFWYARGVGKVREERPAESRIEELVSVSIPGGREYP